MNILVSNLSVYTTSNNLRNLFAEFGAVRSAMIIKENISKKINNLCWIVMDDKLDATHAIDTLNKSVFMHQTITVTTASLRK